MNPKQKYKGRLKNVVVERSKAAKPRATSPAEPNKHWVIPAICIFLAAITLAVYGQTLRFEFVNFDDNHYVYENSNVTSGLTLKGIDSAFTHGESDNWVPLTTISHMLDCQLYGLNAGGHHLTNVLLHIISVILLFLVLRQMTGTIWRSAFVATVFAVHPLHVESVAWVSERKDTLSGLFFMLTLGAYVHYVRRPPSLPRYLMVLLLFALGLMSKPMLVTLPFVLLLLDYWPLKRFSNDESVHGLKNFSVPVQLVLEKIPLLMLSLAACIVTVLVQGHKIQAFNPLPFSMRAGNALVSCITYLWQMFYPANLAVLYPYPFNGLPVWKIIVAAVVLVAISLGAFLGRRKHAYLLVGWLWYLGMLVPVIGLIQVGDQALADRYTYLPQIGLYLILAWLAVELFIGWRNNPLILSSLAFVSIITLVFFARAQASYWTDSETLWNRALACTSDNALACYGLGDAQLQKGQVDEAIIQFQKALAIDSNYAPACNNLGFALAQKGQMDEAIIEYQKALAIDPNYAEACNNLGNALVQKGQMDEAIAEYQKALSINPNDADSYGGLGNALFEKGAVDEAITEYQKALSINPNYAEVCFDLGDALAQKGRVDEAITQFQKVLAINPNDAQTCNNLGNCLLQKGQVDDAVIEYQKALAIQPGFVEAQNALTHIAWGLATSPDSSHRNGTEAIELAQETDRLTGGGDPGTAATLAAAYAEAGKFAEAITNVQRALQLASNQNNPAMIAALQAQLKCYQAGSPFRTTGTAH